MSERLNKIRKLIRKRNPASVLAAIAEFEFEEGQLPRNKDLTKKLSFSKGAISNKCRELVNTGFIHEENNRYRVRIGHLRNRYGSHFRKYLKREGAIDPRKEKMEVLDEIRTFMADQMGQVIKEQGHESKIEKLLKESVLEIGNRPGVETVRDAFLWTDESIRSLAQQVANQILEGEKVTNAADRYGWLLIMAACMDHAHPDISSIMEDQFEEEFVSIDPVQSDTILQAMERIGLLQEIRDYDPSEHSATVSMDLT